jgi:Domain of unknown function (DUF397)
MTDWKRSCGSHGSCVEIGMPEGSHHRAIRDSKTGQVIIPKDFPCVDALIAAIRAGEFDDLGAD